MLEKMIKECAPGETFDEDVKTALLQLADDFVEEVAMQSHKLAKLRNADVIDVKDVALHLEREWDIVVPGTSGEELKPYKRPQKPGTQTQREAKVRKSMARAVEAKILLEKERRREERRMAKLQRQAQARASGQKEEESESDDSSSDEE
jgi:transcription initiation factor TFIID subunit 12